MDQWFTQYKAGSQSTFAQEMGEYSVDSVAAVH